MKLTYLASVLMLTLAYALAGHLVVSMGLHAQVVPLWVPAGIGLGTLWYYGSKLWPGVFLGNLLFNLSIHWRWQNTLNFDESLQALVMALGASAHVLLAFYLLRPRIHNLFQLAKEEDAFFFVLYAGALTSLVSAGIGSSALHFIGQSEYANTSWWDSAFSWWMGDTFGAVLVTPVVLLMLRCFHQGYLCFSYRAQALPLPVISGDSKDQDHHHWQSNNDRRLFILLLGIALGVILLNYFYLQQQREQLSAHFAKDVQVVEARLQAWMQKNLKDLSSLERQYTQNQGLTPTEFRDATWQIFRTNPSVRAYSWDPLIHIDQRQTFEQDTRTLLARSDYQVRGETLSGHQLDHLLLPVKYVEPLYVNQAALGFNLLSKEDRQRWVIQAQSQSGPIATQILRLVQDQQQPAFLILHPVYQQAGEALMTSSKHLAGYMVGVFTVDSLIKLALQEANLNFVAVSAYERSASTPFYQTRVGLGQDIQNLPLHEKFTIEVAHQHWHLHIQAGHNYLSANQGSSVYHVQSLLVLIACLATAVLLTTHSREYTLAAKVQRKTQDLNYLARHDILTGLPNRLFLQEKVAALLSQTPSKSFALFFIDLDRFKIINDSLGHQVGDDLLNAVGHYLTQVLPKEGDLIRNGGDEFVFIYPFARHHSAEENACLAQEVAETILCLGQYTFDLKQLALQVTSSVGISLSPKHGTTLDALIKHADTAMYAAKAQGKNTYAFYTEEQTDVTVRYFALEQDLRSALLQDNELTLHYQPQFKLNIYGDAYLSGFEALVRWHHPQQGWLSPGEFIPLAEETRLIIPLGWKVIELACQQIRLWLDAGYHPPLVAVNISALQLLQSDFNTKLDSLVHHYGLQAEHLELEITESLLMQDPEYTENKLHQLRHAGYRLALDDFGTGYSSLHRLKRLPLDRLKIDRSFVQDIGQCKEDEAIIQTVLQLGTSLGMQVLAEGIETQEQLMFLARRGCHEVQGFLLGRPQAASECNFLLAAEHLDGLKTPQLTHHVS
ncbi:diguanylate cyclase (GGDEF) domain-containing protein [Allopseudospirillum japonicum]|uniref:Diguanylate cyclase (GGDEF) domain-containing protein n=1 Tax=Allopseudospirillum japonicum TaxID=64971 RepID=A0A1H6SSL5_9GAMM|nr:EAL domain-containing protein [Allopseudospirillum japonicum]SEI70978.1 diguanylate cyclase (GGDEF) domain-containing protein [Allopseudospirillum japonicum]